MAATRDSGPGLCCKPGGRLDMSHGFVHHIRRNQLARDDYDKKVKQAAKEKVRRRHTPAPTRPRKPDLQVYLPRHRGEASRPTILLEPAPPSGMGLPQRNPFVWKEPLSIPPRLNSSHPFLEPPSRRSPTSAQCFSHTTGRAHAQCKHHYYRTCLRAGKKLLVCSTIVFYIFSPSAERKPGMAIGTQDIVVD
ncbi:PREDICTED: UPF0561 protein C2orf68 homolog isoform X1 [Condylura cristata]|uniref:UPF0561 protein C2orf68 homolog isoform X1 n=1 Tax=Condylura cristata TaxID=143302 RepID=UPI0006438E3B|nr:PREDICTED: UPF0561 protein C2orf68 homolog isoform X1 [Condylura cristata]